MKKVAEKIKSSRWAKRAMKLGGLYIALEVILVLGALIFVGQSSI